MVISIDRLDSFVHYLKTFSRLQEYTNTKDFPETVINAQAPCHCILIVASLQIWLSTLHDKNSHLENKRFKSINYELQWSIIIVIAIYSEDKFGHWKSNLYQQ